jgi:CheY-like chemotaxis protein
MEKVINLLLVEDDGLDVINIRRTLDKMKIFYRLHTVRNGEEAIEMLEEMGLNGSEGLPDFMLIDINMPRMDGLELLGIIRQRTEWKGIKCYIITTSEESTDKQKAAALGVAGYIVKPLKLTNPSSMDAFNLMIDLLNEKS